MGKQSAPPAPDYTPIANADEAIANQQFQLGENQLAWAKKQFNQTWPFAQQYLTSQTTATNEEQQVAQEQKQFYDENYKPIEKSFSDYALNYNTPERAEADASRSMADVASTFDQNRNAALEQLESYGIDPSQTRYAALDLGTRISQAAATAAAGTQSRLNTLGTGLALQGEAINTGRGYPGSIAQAYSTATNAGSAGLGAANQTTTTGSNAMQGSLGFTNSGLAANAGATAALNTGYSNSLAGAEFNAQQSNQFSSGIGSLIGGGIGLSLLGGWKPFA